MKTLTVLTLVCLAGALSASAQVISSFAGERSAYDYAYGYPGVAASSLQISAGNAATGVSSITLVSGTVAMSGQSAPFNPLATNAPIIVGVGANAETLTPTAVSNCGFGLPTGTCVVTGTFTKLHGPNEPVISGTYGLQEAINIAAAGGASGGGIVAVTSGWAGLGGTTALITAAAVASNVSIIDRRLGAGAQWWTVQPSTLTLLAAPAVLTAATVASGTATGTWPASATYVCITYVDVLGGEGPCSATYNFTPTLNIAINFTTAAAPASTGAVGWRAYAGASYALAYLLPITSTNCTLTTLESVVPACAIGAAAVFTTANTTTTQLSPAPATPLAAANNVVPQGHTTFAYQQSAANPFPFQTMFGPFPAMSGGTTAGQVAVLGSMQLPTAYLNTIGRTVRVSGKIIGAVNTATTPSVLLKLGWAGGDTAGVGITLATIIDTVAYGASATFNHNFSCTLTTNAVGATAIGSIQPDCTMTYTNQTGATVGVAIGDNANAAVGSLGLFSQDTLYVYYTGATNATSSLQLMDLKFETLL